LSAWQQKTDESRDEEPAESRLQPGLASQDWLPHNYFSGPMRSVPMAMSS
jgi:hypothetical protein